MKISEIHKDYMNGSPSEKLSIISSLLTVVTFILAIITSQFFAFKYIVDSRTYIAIGLYLLALGISLIVVYLYQLWVQFINKTYEQLILKVAFILIATSSFAFSLVVIWTFILQIQVYS